MPSEGCSQKFRIVLGIFDVLVGIALILLGAYRFYQTRVAQVRDFFLSFYYIFFGTLLCVSELPCKKLMVWFHFLTYPAGKSLYLLFLSALTFDITQTMYIAMTMALIICGISQIIYLVIGYTPPQSESKPKQDVKRNNSKDIQNPPNFQRVELEEKQKGEENQKSGLNLPSSILPRRK